MKGPASRFALDPAVLVAFLDQYSVYVTDGMPRRQRLHINDIRVDGDDARIIRRWRSGRINGVTKGAGMKLLDHYGLTLETLAGWAQTAQKNYVLRGQLSLPLTS